MVLLWLFLLVGSLARWHEGIDAFCDGRSVGDRGELVKTSPHWARAGGWHVERGPADLQGIHA